MALYLQEVQSIHWALVQHLQEIARVGADVMWVKCQQDSWCCVLCLQQILPHGLFLALPNTENWSKKLHRIYLGKDREHWRVWRCTWKFLENHLFHQDISQRSEPLGFDSTEAGQCLCWEIGEGGITVMKARNDDLNKCLCNLRKSKWTQHEYTAGTWENISSKWA